ncbi:UNVERIFIED_CONTAM: hypothetical protein Sangu_2660800 [Sesamum angustifolium]|uniref:Integrase catalytic domain-containing protein n=1 Tax=Sesamum angustifolium TaxID=2727405 RepID=A0AAW2J1N5_9LAMI
MSNNIQKQYDRLDDISSIMLRMSDVYAVLNRHTRYATTKAFFGTKLTEGSFLQSHGVIILFPVEKFGDLKVRLDMTHTLMGCGVHIYNDLQVLQGSKRLIKDEMILRLGDGKAIAAEVIVSVELAISHHDRVIVNDYLYVRNMIKNIIAIPNLDKEGCLWIIKSQARGGYSYFITCTDDHSRYDYVYLVRYKFEAFRRFKEYRLKVEDQTDRKIKALLSDRCREYLIGGFLDYLKENEILSQWTPPGTLQLNGVSGRMNQTLLDMVRSMMSFTKLLLSLWGYALDMVAKLLKYGII